MTNKEASEILVDYFGCLMVPRCNGKLQAQHRLEEAMEMALEALSPSERKGKWIDIDSETYMWMIKCDQCGHLRSMMSTNGIYPNFCENCGAKM